jgi:ATP-dependent Clp protease ATP-binding subunit ClpC
VFQRFSPQARRIIIPLANEEARRLNHHSVGTEHLLLGLLRQGTGIAAGALERFGVSLEAVENEVRKRVAAGKAVFDKTLQFTPRAKKALGLSSSEALRLNHPYIGTEHLLLGIIRSGDGVAVEVLVSLGVDLEQLRNEVTDHMTESTEWKYLAADYADEGRPSAAEVAIGSTLDGVALEGLMEFHVNPSPKKVYRLGSSTWKRDRMPFMIHLGKPGAKKTLCGWPRRWLEVTDTDVVEQTDRYFGGRLPLCAACRSIANGGEGGDFGPLIARGRMGWFRPRPLK